MKSPFTTVAESESTGTGLAVPLGDPKQVFKLGGTLPFVQAVRDHVASLKPFLDVSTKDGRSLIASTAYRIARTKTFAFAKAKELSAVYKAIAKEIDGEADNMSTELDKLKHETRAPLTEWEEKDKERNGEFETRIGEIYDACLFVGAPTIEAIQQRMAKLRGYQSIAWYEYSDRAMEAFKQSIPALEAMLEVAEKAEADRVELEELRAYRANRGVELPTVIADFGAEFIPPKPDGEAIPPRGETIIGSGLTLNEDAHRTQIEYEIEIGLALIVDYDKASDIVSAIKAGKIRHVQIVY